MNQGKQQQQPTVKNKSPAPVQITAEQLLQEATARIGNNLFGSGGSLSRIREKQRALADRRDLGEFREKERKAFEDNIRRNRGAIGVWIKYARFEEAQHDYPRARSVYERALEVDPRNVTLWLKYVLMEMRAGHVNLTRNVLDRAVTILPRIDSFWFKYVHMEEMLGNLEAAVQVWERWMIWEPEASVWWSYVKFAERHKQWTLIREIIQRLLQVHSDDSDNWIKAARFFADHLKDVQGARLIFERALDFVGTRNTTIWIEMAKWEARDQGEIERARALYKLALETFKPPSLIEDEVDRSLLTYNQSTQLVPTFTSGDSLVPFNKKVSIENCTKVVNYGTLFNSFAAFERQFGTEHDIEQVTLRKRLDQYEQKVIQTPGDYDLWLDYISLLEDIQAPLDSIREAYERAIANQPTERNKRAWRRYCYLWLGYACLEELQARDMDRAEMVFKAAMSLDSLCQFAKLWIAWAEHYLRKHNLESFRMTMGQALGHKPGSTKVITLYIQREASMGHFDRVRMLHERWIELTGGIQVKPWIAYAEFEAAMDEQERSRTILHLATSMKNEIFNNPEALWRCWIELEMAWGCLTAIPGIYEALLDKTGGHVKVWLAYARFCYDKDKDGGNDDQANVIEGDKVMERAFDHFKTQPQTRLLVLEAWRAQRLSLGLKTEDIDSLFPRRVRREKPISNEIDEGWELIFPDDESGDEELSLENPLQSLLQAAVQWKEQNKD